MKTFLISYDLRKPGQNYSELYETLKSLGDWRHPLESVWVAKIGDYMDMDIDANEIYKRIRPKVDNGDFLFIVDITDKDHQGWLSKEFWDWL